MTSRSQQSTDNSVSNNARNNILAKLKAQVNGADYSKLPEEKGYKYPSLTKQAQIEQFITHLEANHAEIIKLNKNEIPTVINNVLKKRDINSLLMGQSLATGQLELATQLDTNISVKTFDFSLYEKQENKDNLFNQTPASITQSHSAIAATGTIVLWPTIDEPRSLSLVPPVHIVIVDADTIHQDFSSLIKAQKWQDKLPTNLVLASGPSKTADIQQTLAYGAHGPKELIVLLLNSE